MENLLIIAVCGGVIFVVIFINIFNQKIQLKLLAFELDHYLSDTEIDLGFNNHFFVYDFSQE